MLQANTPSKPRLLILDEDRIILQSLSQFLRREGYEVKTTDRPEEAMAILEAGQVELLLTDVNVPGVKPVDFLREVRRRFAQVVVVVITSYGSIEGAVEATKMGAFDYLTKPIDDEEIRTVVEKAARQKSLPFENQTLRQQLDLRFGLENAIGHDHRMLKVFDPFEPVGSTETKTVDVRVVLATNVDLHQLVAENKFRQDLYYRINVINVKLPGLRDRLGDIPLLAGHFLRRLAAETKREVLGFTPE